ncbi:transporter [Thalassotalea sp. PP2-459]|nr:transporter [Thalassotalea sp. PP2-459]
MFSVALSAHAQNIISLNEAIGLSLKQHPELRSYIYKKESALALVEQASVGSPMTINASAEDAFGAGSYSGVKGLQTTLSISWLLDKDLIDSRVKLANTKVSSASIKQEVKAIDIASETARIYITLLSQMMKFDLAKLAQRQSQQVLEQIERKVKAGKSFVVDELRAKAALSLIELEVEDLAHEIEASKSQLAAQWKGNTSFVVNGNLANIPSLKDLNVALEDLKANPQLKQFLIEQDVMQSEIDLATVEQKPAWSISTGIKRNEAVDDFAFTAGISIPLGGDNRNRGQITSLQARQKQSRAKSDALYQRISTQALLLTHKLKHNRHVIDALTNKSIPYFEEASKKAGEAYRLGSYRYTDWHAVQQELVQAQSDLIDAYTNIQLFNIELERLTGTSVSM